MKPAISRYLQVALFAVLGALLGLAISFALSRIGY